jgi:hypothetical protein
VCLLGLLGCWRYYVVVEYPCGGKASVYKSPVYIWDRSQRAGSNTVGSWLEGGRASPQNQRALKSSFLPPISHNTCVRRRYTAVCSTRVRATPSSQNPAVSLEMPELSADDLMNTQTTWKTNNEAASFEIKGGSIARLKNENENFNSSAATETSKKLSYLNVRTDVIYRMIQLSNYYVIFFSYYFLISFTIKE